MNHIENLDAASCRMSAAVAAGEPPEVVHALMMDVVAAIDLAGEDSSATRRTANTLRPMFGMHADTERAALPWWRRRKYQPPDYAARAQAYRDGVHRG